MSKSTKPLFSILLTLSTAHLTEDTLTTLEQEPERNQFCMSVYPNPFGCFLYVGSQTDTPLTDNIPKDLQDCIQFARKNNCDWIKFDRDVEPLSNDTLPVISED